ncbi:acyltransferase, partial [Pseudoalteromonas sp. BSi20439]|uniref:acyltransferase family protein n=1 Tax=Pseudoalteromonas sp. BSi20439 TaxID=420915 RepID=UPI00056B01B6
MNEKLFSVQVLRGFACLAVIISHAIGKALNSESIVLPLFISSTPELITFGHFGVDLFFIISGFIMFTVHYKDFGTNGAWKKFLIARFIRLVPIYWLLSSLALVILLIAPELFQHRSSAEIYWVLGSYFFIPVTTSYGLSSPLLGVGWSLNYEMLFYISFAFFLCFFRSYKSLGILSIIGSVSVIIGGNWHLKVTGEIMSLITSPLLLEFLIGIFCGYLFIFHKDTLVHYKRYFLLGSFIIFLCSFIYIPSNYGERFLLWGGGSALLLISALMYEYLFQKTSYFNYVFERFGAASYSAYLIQVFSLPFFSKVFLLMNLGTNWLIYVVFIVFGTV